MTSIALLDETKEFGYFSQRKRGRGADADGGMAMVDLLRVHLG
jgi:hypothetical protein